MRRTGWTILLLALCGPALGAAPRSDVWFANGDKLRGRVERIANGQVVIATDLSPDRPLRVPLSSIKKIVFDADAKPAPPKTGDRMLLHDGGVVFGAFRGLTEKGVRFDAHRLGSLVIPARDVREIVKVKHAPKLPASGSGPKPSPVGPRDRPRVLLELRRRKAMEAKLAAELASAKALLNKQDMMLKDLQARRAATAQQKMDEKQKAAALAALDAKVAAIQEARADLLDLIRRVQAQRDGRLPIEATAAVLAFFKAEPDEHFRIRTSRGDTLVGRVSQSGEGELAVTTGAVQAKVSIESIVAIAFPKPGPAPAAQTRPSLYCRLRLRNGTVVQGYGLRLEADRLHLQLLGGSPISVKRDDVLDLQLGDKPFRVVVLPAGNPFIAFTDGQPEFITESVDRSVWQALSTRAGPEPCNDDDY